MPKAASPSSPPHPESPAPPHGRAASSRRGPGASGEGDRGQGAKIPAPMGQGPPWGAPIHGGGALSTVRAAGGGDLPGGWGGLLGFFLKKAPGRAGRMAGRRRWYPKHHSEHHTQPETPAGCSCHEEEAPRNPPLPQPPANPLRLALPNAPGEKYSSPRPPTRGEAKKSHPPPRGSSPRARVGIAPSSRRVPAMRCSPHGGGG